MLTKLISEIENNTLSYANSGYNGDVNGFKALWNKVFKQDNLRIQLIFLKKLAFVFNYTDDLFEVIQKDLLDHPNSLTRLAITRFLHNVGHRIHPTEKYQIAIGRAFSDPDESVRMMAFNALTSYRFAGKKETFPQDFIEKGLDIYKKILLMPASRLNGYDMVMPLIVFGANISICANEINHFVASPNSVFWRIHLVRFLFGASQSFHHFFPTIRYILERPQDEKLLKAALNTMHTVAWCKPTHDPKIQELIPDLQELKNKNISLEFKIQIDALIDEIKEGPVKDEVYLAI